MLEGVQQRIGPGKASEPDPLQRGIKRLKKDVLIDCGNSHAGFLRSVEVWKIFLSFSSLGKHLLWVC